MLNMQSFISKPISIDFIANHELQAIACQSVFDAMNKHFKCQWLMGYDQKPTGADAAILVDHRAFQPKINKNSGGYKYLFHMSHDLADMELYGSREEWFDDFDIIFVPTNAHLKNARDALGFMRNICVIGWPKYDLMELPMDYSYIKDKIEKFPYKQTIIYAPTFADNWEWKELFPIFLSMEYNVILKNHIYVGSNKIVPSSSVNALMESLLSVQEMETVFLNSNKPNLIVAPRSSNICSLFPYAQMLISDRSSCLMEFLPFGIAVETGRFGRKTSEAKPEVNLICDKVDFLPGTELCKLLRDEERLNQFVSLRRLETNRIPEEIKFPFMGYAGQTVAQLIDKYIYLNQSTY